MYSDQTARLLEVGGITLEEPRISEHAQRRSAMALVAGGNVRRGEVLAQHALARARLLDLGDDTSLACGDLRAQAADEVALAAERLGVSSQ